MQRRNARSLALCGVLVLVAAATPALQQPSPPAAASRPNVILIMTDDMGYADLGSQPAITCDWSASLAAVSGAAVPAPYEGIDLFPILEGRAPKVARTLFWRTAPNSNRSQQAVPQGDWKLVVDANHMLLFNLRDDIGERRDLTAQRPDLVRRLRPMIAEWARSVDADAAATKQAPDGGAAVPR